MPVPVLEREECNTDTPFGQYREKSSQRLIYTRKTSHLVTELNYRHVLFKDYLGTAPDKHYLYQASFKGYNMTSPLEFKVGRIGAGNNRFQTIDGISWYYPWGNRLYTTFDLGRISSIDDSQKNKPSFSEGRLHYRFNEKAFMAVKAVKQYDESFGSAMFGYNGDDLLVTGEVLGGSATDTLHLAMQYISERKFDLTSDYIINQNDVSDSGIMRHYLGLETGEIYIESGIGSHFWFNGPDIDESWFYEGSLTWGNSSSDNLTAGYLVESTPASSSRTIFARAERKVSKKTTLMLGVEDTTFENSAGSVQNLEGGIRRKVQWGYFELRGAVISGGADSDMQKDVRLRAGYEF
ncbi:MAG: hypothetical protein PWR01_3558 [Clostridiales bacterium]|nr:hypothetical protein [Clostridiales bacterium]MDN5282485.1 hypothetical protein [Candidatus Ozemobacter sp.]